MPSMMETNRRRRSCDSWQGIVQHPFQPTWVQETKEESICHPAPSHLEQEEEEEEEETEEEDVSPEQDTIRVIQQHLQGRAELVEDRAQQLGFLHVVPRLCFLAQQQELDSLEPQVSKGPSWKALR
ncbi:hypothetical protein KIL84_009522 [Mauremys mutica]|uniref:Uncharacterized protein n=1 Tax=Mauremys mutica TaxID=74926 RepID=A0A9D4ANT1_9SAUR|nr:hypothetical protein KIL84_009522 [Mauremys mutica]